MFGLMYLIVMIVVVQVHSNTKDLSKLMTQPRPPNGTNLDAVVATSGNSCFRLSQKQLPVQLGTYFGTFFFLFFERLGGGVGCRNR